MELQITARGRPLSLPTRPPSRWCRSHKVDELAACPWAEVAWYFADSREQYRLLGRVTVVGEGAPADDKLQRARAAAWKNMSDPGRQQFLWPAPGLPRGTGEEGEAEDPALFKPPPPGKDDPVAASFCLCILEVEQTDLLSLAANTRRAFRRRAGGEGDAGAGVWEEANVNP